jgi:TolB protein
MVQPALAVCLLALMLVATSRAAAEPAVAYLHRDGAYWQAWVMNPDGSSPRALSRSPSEKTGLAWFPDGRSLLVTTEQGDVLRVHLGDDREERVALPLREIADAAVSPDGKQIAFSVSPARSRDDHEVYLANLDGTGLRQLTNEKRVQHQPVWHPDGGSVFFVSRANDEGHDIWRVLLPGGSLEQVTVGRGLHFDADVRADGALAYSNNASGNYEIWVQLPGQEPRALTDHPAVDGAPAWSPDGRELLFESSRSGQLELWRVGVEGGEPVRVTTTPAGARRPVWLRSAQ